MHIDTTKRRRADSRRILQRWERIFSAPLPPLYHVVVSLWAGDIYSAADIQQAKSAAQTILDANGSPAAWVKLEGSRAGVLHLHIVTDDPDFCPPGAHKTPVHDAAGLAEYLSKPNDGRLCKKRPSDLARYSPDEFWRQNVDALTAQDAARRARNGKRCPPRVWVWMAEEELAQQPAEQPRQDAPRRPAATTRPPVTTRAPRVTHGVTETEKPRPTQRFIAWRWSGGICFRGLPA